MLFCYYCKNPFIWRWVQTSTPPSYPSNIMLSVFMKNCKTSDLNICQHCLLRSLAETKKTRRVHVLPMHLMYSIIALHRNLMSGYRLEGDFTCLDINECEQYLVGECSAFEEGGQCVNTPGSFHCVCNPSMWKKGNHMFCLKWKKNNKCFIS